MPSPAPWSFSSLEDFVNCPRAYYEKRIVKSVKDEPTVHTIWGEEVHKHFEERQKNKVPLPDKLQEHEEYMKILDRMRGTLFTEQKVALNKQLQPCDFFDKDVWFRGIIDWIKVDGKHIRIRDYKTGKQHSKFKQLKLFALYAFAKYPNAEWVEVKFYWTKTKTVSGETYVRDDILDYWREFIPDLKQYAEAFKTDTWQPRQSGLCYGWCPVTQCEFWKPKRR